MYLNFLLFMYFFYGEVIFEVLYNFEIKKYERKNYIFKIKCIQKLLVEFSFVRNFG